MAKKKVAKKPIKMARNLKDIKPPIGRPTTCPDNIIELVEEFFFRPHTLDEMKEVAGKDGPVTILVKVGNVLPTVKGFCAKYRITRSNFYRWCQDNDGLSDTLEIARAYQEEMLAHLALTGKYNPTFAKFMATNLTDLKENINYTVNLSSKSDDDLLSEARKIMERMGESTL
jgi:hypothetical protein